MRKVIFGAAVVFLAGACWVLAQNASSDRLSIRSAQAAPGVKAPPPETDNAAVPPTTGPVTEIDVSDAPSSTPTPSSTRTPSSAPALAPNGLPIVPMPALPTTRTGMGTQGALPPEYSVMSESPNSMPNGPLGYQPPPLMTTPDKTVIQSTIQPAVKGLPNLPPVPGVTPAPPGIPSSANAIGRDPGQSTVGANQLPQPEPTPGSLPLNPDQPPPIWTDNNPKYWNDREIVRTLSGPRVWGGAEYLLWFVKSGNAPALVDGIYGAQPGQTAFSGSQVVNLYPNGTIDYRALNGVRGTLGFWLTESQSIGFESSYFWFASGKTSDSFSSTPFNLLARPFFNVATGGESLYQLSSTNGTQGYVTVHNNLAVQGGDANFLTNSLPLGSRLGQQLTLLGGFRYLQIIESLHVDETSVNAGSGFSSSSFDHFGTRNQFYGGQLGLRWSYEGDRFFANMTGKMAYGAMLEHVSIDGSTVVSTPSGVSSANGGVLALPSNIGVYNQTHMTFIPEATASVGYRFTSWASAFLGYNFLFVHDMVRPGSQIDTGVNTANLPFSSGSTTVQRPTFSFHGDTFWMQGVNLGLRLAY